MIHQHYQHRHRQQQRHEHQRRRTRGRGGGLRAPASGGRDLPRRHPVRGAVHGALQVLQPDRRHERVGAGAARRGGHRGCAGHAADGGGGAAVSLPSLKGCSPRADLPSRPRSRGRRWRRCGPRGGSAWTRSTLSVAGESWEDGRPRSGRRTLVLALERTRTPRHRFVFRCIRRTRSPCIHAVL